MATLRDAYNMGMNMWSPYRAARLMAILQVFGNNEGFTLSKKFNCDRRFIEEIFRLTGGKTPDPQFVDYLKHWVDIYENVIDKDDTYFTEAKKWIYEKYGFNLYM